MMMHILSTTAGLVLFLFAMIRLTETVRRNVTSSRTRKLFRYAVRTPLWGVVTGILVTILFQSSSAATVLTVGLVSAGLISFFHSLGVILGADIGTTLTVQLVVWRITDLSPLLVIGGALFWSMGRGKYKSLGEGIFYFGLMFFGLSIVTQATEPLKESPAMIRFFRETTNPFVGVLIGCGFTALIQSSAIPIALLVILAGHDMLTIEGSLPLILGANLGTAATAIIAAIAANREGRRTALSHAFFKLSGVFICFFLLSPFVALLRSASVSVAQQIALAHIIFNLFVALIFIPILPCFSRFALSLLPGKGESFSLWPEFLDETLLNNPATALEAAGSEMKREMLLARRMYNVAIDVIGNYRTGTMRTIGYLEDVVNALEREIARYLRRISEGSLSHSTSKKLFLYSSMVSDIERIADHALNISELSELKAQKNIFFSPQADQDLADIEALVRDNLDGCLSLMENRNEEVIDGILAREELVDRQVMDARIRHLDRYYKKICQAEAGPLFIGIVVNLERISDHCENIAEYFRDLSPERE